MAKTNGDSEGVRFFLNREARARHVLPAEAAGATVLNWLRANGFTGSKEGCAAGDCGACTAVVAEPTAAGGLRYSSLNTCIALMSALDGKLLITVEGLADENGKLHPAQSAMAAAHASQCGFCTPGFVMSLFAAAKNPPPRRPKTAAAKHAAICEAISGNLCRCTGYAPIVRAAAVVLRGKPPPDFFAKQERVIARRLRGIAAPAVACGVVVNARQLAQARAARPNAAPLGGGTDFALQATQQERALPPLVDISRLQEWRGIANAGSHWRIGATTTIAELLAFCERALPQMAPFLRRFGSPPIRARATVGGNICNASPIGDLPPPFIALAAAAVLINAKGKTRRLPLQEFFIDYKKTAAKRGEWLRAVLLPKPPANSVFKVFKVSKRIEDDISAVSGGFLWELQNNGKNGQTVAAARLAFGGMAATPKRAAACERAFVGRAWTAQTAAAAARALTKDFAPLSDARASAAYRLRAAQGIVCRAFAETQAAPPPRIEEICA